MDDALVGVGSMHGVFLTNPSLNPLGCSWGAKPFQRFSMYAHQTKYMVLYMVQVGSQK